MKKIIICLISGVLLFSLFHYLWYTMMEQRIYIEKNYTKVFDGISIFQSWRTTASLNTLGFPYKKVIYTGPYKYNLSFEIQNINIDEIIIRELLVILPDQKINLYDKNITINYGGNILNEEQILNFKDSKTLEISLLRNMPNKNISLIFDDVDIPYHEINEFKVKMFIMIKEKSVDSSLKEVLSEFKKEKVMTRISPSS